MRRNWIIFCCGQIHVLFVSVRHAVFINQNILDKHLPTKLVSQCIFLLTWNKFLTSRYWFNLSFTMSQSSLLLHYLISIKPIYIFIIRTQKIPTTCNIQASTLMHSTHDKHVDLECVFLSGTIYGTIGMLVLQWKLFSWETWLYTHYSPITTCLRTYFTF